MKNEQNVNVENVEETTPVVENEKVVNEASVQAEETAEVEAPKKGKTSFLFNLLSLCIAAAMLVAEIYLLIAMFTGIIRVGDTPFTINGIMTYFRRTVAVGFGFTSLEFQRIGGLVILAMFIVVYIVFLINIIIGTIKSIVKVFSFLKLKRERSETELAFSKYVKTICKNYGLGIIFVALSLVSTSSLTGLGVGVVVLGTLMYAGLAVFKQLLITPAAPERGLISKIIDLGTELGRRAVMLMVAFLLVASITPCLTNFFAGLDNFVYTSEIFFPDAENITQAVGVMYTSFIRELLLIIPFALCVSIAGKIAKWYVFNNGKKDVNGGLFRDFIGLFAVSLVLCIADCVMINMAGTGSVGAAVGAYIGIMLTCVAGAVISFVSRDKSVVVAR